MVRKKILSLLLVKAPVAFVALSVALVVLLRWVPVRYTPVMLKRQVQSGSIRDGRPRQEWVPLEEVSPSLVGAVLASEDQRFMHHHGFDFQELKMMAGAHRKEGTPVRGCSTISQQTAKNVFTFGTPTVLRKVSEAWWTVLIESMWRRPARGFSESRPRPSTISEFRPAGLTSRGPPPLPLAFPIRSISGRTAPGYV